MIFEISCFGASLNNKFVLVKLIRLLKACWVCLRQTFCELFKLLELNECSLFYYSSSSWIPLRMLLMDWCVVNICILWGNDLVQQFVVNLISILLVRFFSLNFVQHYYQQYLCDLLLFLGFLSRGGFRVLF